MLAARAVKELELVTGEDTNLYLSMVTNLQRGIRTHLITTGDGTNANKLWGIIKRTGGSEVVLSATAQWRFKNLPESEFFSICRDIAMVNSTVATSGSEKIVGSIVTDYLPDPEESEKLLIDNSWLVFCYFIAIAEKVEFKKTLQSHIVMGG